MAKKSDKRVQDVPVQVRMREVEQRYIQTGADAMSAKSPMRVGFSPFMRWAALQETARQTGVTFEEFEAQDRKGGGKKS